MRSTFLTLIALGFCLAGHLEAQSSTRTNAAVLYKQGLQAMKQGEVETARRCFNEVLRLQPRHTSARFQLKQLNLRSGSLKAKKRQLQMGQVTLPKVEFDEITLPEALEALEELVLQQTRRKFSPNFIIHDAGEVFETRKFSLKLGQVPASIALKYCLENARATARFDEHAIVVRPLGSAGAPPANKETSANQDK